LGGPYRRSGNRPELASEPLGGNNEVVSIGFNLLVQAA